MGKYPLLGVNVSLDVEEWESIREKSKSSSFSHLVHARLFKLLSSVECPDDPTLISRRIVKKVDITGSLAPKLTCISSSMNIQPGTYIYKYVIIPLMQEIKAEKDKANK